MNIVHMDRQLSGLLLVGLYYGDWYYISMLVFVHVVLEKSSIYLGYVDRISEKI